MIKNLNICAGDSENNRGQKCCRIVNSDDLGKILLFTEDTGAVRRQRCNIYHRRDFYFDFYDNGDLANLSDELYVSGDLDITSFGKSAAILGSMLYDFPIQEELPFSWFSDIINQRGGGTATISDFLGVSSNSIHCLFMAPIFVREDFNIDSHTCPCVSFYNDKNIALSINAANMRMYIETANESGSSETYSIALEQLGLKSSTIFSQDSVRVLSQIFILYAYYLGHPSRLLSSHLNFYRIPSSLKEYITSLRDGVFNIHSVVVAQEVPPAIRAALYF